MGVFVVYVGFKYGASIVGLEPSYIAPLPAEFTPITVIVYKLPDINSIVANVYVKSVIP